MPFQTPFPPGSGAFDGTITATVHEQGNPEPTFIIKTSDPWTVDVNWTNTGFLQPMTGGTYDLHLLLERMGPGTDLDLVDSFNIADHIIPLTPGVTDYTKPVDINPADVPTNPIIDGVYKLVVLLRYYDLTGAPGPIAAYEEISPLLQFYTP